MQPRIIIASGKQHTRGRTKRAIATASIYRGRPTIHVWMPKKFTRRVYEHELAHLPGQKRIDALKSKRKYTLFDELKEEVRVERIANRAMGRGDRLNDDTLVGIIDRIYYDSMEYNPQFAKVIKTLDVFMKHAHLLKDFGISDDEIRRFKRLKNNPPTLRKYHVTQYLKSGNRKAIETMDVLAPNKIQAIDMAKDSVPVDDVVWELTDSKTQLI
jgi:hypothetical protein